LRAQLACGCDDEADRPGGLADAAGVCFGATFEERKNGATLLRTPLRARAGIVNRERPVFVPRGPARMRPQRPIALRDAKSSGCRLPASRALACTRLSARRKAKCIRSQHATGARFAGDALFF